MTRKTVQTDTARAAPKNGPERGKKKGTGQALYFLSITLENIRCFGSGPQTLHLADEEGQPAHFTVILGDNGVGKSTILEALAVIQTDTRDIYEDEQTPSLSSFGWCMNAVRQGTKRSLIRSDTAIGTSYETAKTDDAAVIEYDQSDASHLKGHIRVPDTAGLHFAYGASRHISQSKLTESDSTDTVATLFDASADLINAEEWLLRLILSASTAKGGEFKARQLERLETAKEILSNVLPDVDDIRITTPSKADPDPRVEFHTHYGWVPLNKLSHGYQTMVAWLMDFVARLVDHAPDRKDPLAQPAVCMVDEIDLHMHPRWQRQIMDYLAERFPNTQFILTAHSPLIVQAADERTNIAVLRWEGDHVIIDNQPKSIRNWRLDQILTSDLFGLPSARPPRIEKYLERRKELMSKSRLTARQKQELAEIEEQLGALPGGESAAEAETMLKLAEQAMQHLGKAK